MHKLSPPLSIRQRRRRQSVSAAASTTKAAPQLNIGSALTPWKSADSLVSTIASRPSPARRSRDFADHVPWNIAQRLRRFSLGRPSSSTPSKQAAAGTPAGVVETQTIHKNYDPTTGNKVLNNKYMIVREIGRGVHGKVKLAEDIETHQLVAIKIVDKRTRRRQLGYTMLRSPPTSNGHGSHPGARRMAEQYRENEQKIRREIAILKKCAHPHVVRLLQVMDHPESHKLYMVLEYMEGGEMQWRDENEMPVLGLDEIRSVFRSVVCGLDYLHYQGIIHRDIKPANLLLTRDRVVKISDFGVSYLNEHLAGGSNSSSSSSHAQDEACCDQIDRELAETAGTPAFFAPELCSAPVDDNDSDNDSEQQQQRQQRRQQRRITKAIDVWALGVTLYCFVFGRCPFTAANKFELFNIIPHEPLQFPDPDDVGFDVSDELKDLLHRLLAKNPDERITLEQVKHHPWVIEDLERPEQWWQEADPRRYKTVEVTDDEVIHAVTMMDRIRKSIQKLSSSLSHLTQGITRKRSKTVSYSRQRTPSSPPPPGPQPGPASPASHSNTCRPQSSLSDDTFSRYHHPLEDHPSFVSDDRPELDRQGSTASSSSDKPIMIGRSRGRLGLNGQYMYK